MPNLSPRIALFSNTFSPRDAMGKHVHMILKVFPQTKIFLERGSGDHEIATQKFYFVARYPWLALYMLEWKLGFALPLFHFFLKPWVKLAFWLEARRFQKYDFIWLQWGLYHQGIHLFPALASLPRRPKLIFDYHGVTPPELIKSSGKRLIAQRTIRDLPQGANHADLCLVRSRFMADELRRYAKPKKIVYNPLPFMGAALSTCQQDLRTKYQLTKAKILLYVGRISEHKNLSLVVEAQAKLARQDVYFVVVGNDQHRSLAQEKERLLVLARGLRIPHRIIFTGEIPDAELVCWYRTADVFVMPSRHEGFCWPLVDAMSYGLPILTTREGAIPETVGQAALFFGAQSPAELRDQINVILSDEPKRLELIAQGREKAKEYTWERYQENLRQAIVQL